jgi:hypothetical protein
VRASRLTLPLFLPVVCQAETNHAPSNKRAKTHRGEEERGKTEEGEIDDWVHEAKPLLKRCQSHKKGFYFKEPVDPIALGILDYFEVISDPMDFSTISKKLEHGEYAGKVIVAICSSVLAVVGCNGYGALFDNM